MYIPPYFVNPNRAEALAFMQRYPFGLLIAADGSRPMATHLPFIFAEADGKLYLESHLAAENLQAGALEKGEMLVVFSAPHAYISPSLYDRKENVPTWNYMAVHCYGHAELLPGKEEKIRLLEAMITYYEPAYMAQWRSLLGEGGAPPSKYVDTIMDELVAFRIEVSEVQAASKLSQNKNKAEQERIASHLVQHGDEPARDVAAYMDQQLKKRGTT